MQRWKLLFTSVLYHMSTPVALKIWFNKMLTVNVDVFPVVSHQLWWWLYIQGSVILQATLPVRKNIFLCFSLGKKTTYSMWEAAAPCDCGNDDRSTGWKTCSIKGDWVCIWRNQGGRWLGWTHPFTQESILNHESARVYFNVMSRGLGFVIKFNTNYVMQKLQYVDQ